MNIKHVPLKQGMLYKLASDLNTPDYLFLKKEKESRNTIETYDELFDFLLPKWHRLKQNDILLFVEKGKKVEDIKKKNHISAVRETRKYAFWSADKFEYYFIWKDKIIMIVLCEQDWGKILIQAENE